MVIVIIIIIIATAAACATATAAGAGSRRERGGVDAGRGQSRAQRGVIEEADFELDGAFDAAVIFGFFVVRGRELVPLHHLYMRCDAMYVM